MEVRGQNNSLEKLSSLTNLISLPTLIHTPRIQAFLPTHLKDLRESLSQRRQISDDLRGWAEVAAMWYTLANTALKRLKQEDSEFWASLSYLMRPCLQKAKQQEEEECQLACLHSTPL